MRMRQIECEDMMAATTQGLVVQSDGTISQEGVDPSTEETTNGQNALGHYNVWATDEEEY